MAEAEHLDWIVNDPASRTMTLDDEPIACGGIADQGNGVALAWAVVADLIPRAAVLPLIRTFKAALDSAPFHWIEAQTPVDLPTGLKLDKMLGFEPIGTMTFRERTFQRFRYKGRHGH